MPRTPDVMCSGGCGRMLWRSATSAPRPKCRECRAASAVHGTQGRYDRGCRCDECRAGNSERARLFNDAYKREHGLTYAAHQRAIGRYAQSKRKRKSCGWCGTLHPLNESGTTLDADGLTHAQWLRHYGGPSQSRELVHVPSEPTPREPPDIKRPLRCGGVFAYGPCEECGVDLMRWGSHPDGIPRTCSDRCSRRRSRRLARESRGRFVVSDARRTALYGRDDWTCQICREPMSREYSHSDPWSPTLDHIEPQTAALIPDHSDANLRSAHAICNSIRNDGKLTDAEVRVEVSRRRDVPA